MVDIYRVREKLGRQVAFLKINNGDKVKFNEWHTCLSFVEAVLFQINKTDNHKYLITWMPMCNRAVKRIMEKKEL